MVRINKQKLIKELYEQLGAMEDSDEDMDEASFSYENGVVITGNEAKEFLKLLGDSKD